MEALPYQCEKCRTFMDKGTEVSFKLNKFYIKTSITICPTCIQKITIKEFFELCQPTRLLEENWELRIENVEWTNYKWTN